MAAKAPSVGQLAFKGNIRRAMKKIIQGNASVQLWVKQHPGWPVQLLSAQQMKNLNAVAIYCQTNLILTVPPPKPV
jgi:hypothetical protein